MKPYNKEELKNRSHRNMTVDELRQYHDDMYYRLTLRHLLPCENDGSHYDAISVYMKDVSMEPFTYFGVLGIEFPDLLLTSSLASSKYAMVSAYKKYLELIELEPTLQSRIENKYNLNFEESAVRSLTRGEELVEYQQEVRGISRKEALLFVFFFKMVDIDYLLLCKEFLEIKDKVLNDMTYRPEWKEAIEAKFGTVYKYLRSPNRKYCKLISDRFYAERATNNG